MIIDNQSIKTFVTIICNIKKCTKNIFLYYLIQKDIYLIMCNLYIRNCRNIIHFLYTYDIDLKLKSHHYGGFVPKTGLEPAQVTSHAPQTCLSTSSSIWAEF